MNNSRFESLLRFSLHLLSSLLLVVLSLHVLEFTSQSLDFVLVLIHLSLVHVELSSHSLHLASLLFQVLLIDWQLLSYFWTWLPSQQVLQLNVKLLLFLNVHILLDYLLSLLDQSLLQGLNFLEHFPSIRISSFKSSPSMSVKRIFKLFRKCLHLKSLCKQLLLQVINLFSQIRNLRSLRFDNSQFTLVITDFEFQETDIFKSFLVLNFTTS